MIKREKIHGIFSAKTKSFIGTGTTKRKTEQTTYWYADEQENGVLEVQAINDNFVPSGPIVAVEMEKFLNEYSPEPEIFFEKVIPNMRELENTIVLGESHRKKEESYSAEHEFKKAISIDELNVRANFGLGLTYLDRGEVSRADNIFRRLVCINACYEPQHKHLFNEFGIALRKQGMHSQALKYYERAEKIIDEDENLYMNMARVHYEMGDLRLCLENLKKSLLLNQKLEEACVFLDYLQHRGFIENCTVNEVLEKRETLESLIKCKLDNDESKTITKSKKKNTGKYKLL